VSFSNLLRLLLQSSGPMSDNAFSGGHSARSDIRYLIVKGPAAKRTDIPSGDLVINNKRLAGHQETTVLYHGPWLFNDGMWSSKMP